MSEKKIARKKKKEVQFDGWANVYTGRGVQGIDKRTGRFYKNRNSGILNTLNNALFNAEGMAYRIVTLPVLEATRPNINIDEEIGIPQSKFIKNFKEEYLLNL